MKVDKMGNWRRSHYSADIGPELDGQEVTVFGWVHEIRDLGGLRFLILQDKRRANTTCNWFKRNILQLGCTDRCRFRVAKSFKWCSWAKI